MRGVVAGWMVVAVLALQSSTGFAAPPGFQPPASGTASVYQLKGSLVATLGDEKADFPLVTRVTLNAHGEVGAEQYAVVTEARAKSPFFRTARVAFLNHEEGRFLREHPWSMPLPSGQAEEIAETLLQSLLFPSRLSDDDLAQDRQDLDADLASIGRMEPITCELKIETKADGIHVTRTLVRGDAQSPAGAGVQVNVVSWSQQFLLDATDGRLKQGRLAYRIEIAAGNRSRIDDVNLSLTRDKVQPLSAAQVAEVAADREKLTEIARIPQPTEDAEELKQAQEQLTQSLDELALFEQTRKDSPLAAAAVQIREGLESVLAMVDERVEEAKRLAEFLNKPAPDFTLKNLADEDVSLSEFTRGKVTLLSFWGVGCPPCRVEAPHLTALYEKYKDFGFVVLAVNGWDEPKEAVADYLQRESLRHPVLLMGSQVAEQYQVSALPTTYWIDHKGNVVAHERGFAPGHEQQLEEKIQQLLTARNGKPPVVKPAGLINPK